MNSPTVNIFNTDCITGMREHLAADSVHLTVTSIPFEELFTYSGKIEDVGNNGSTIDVKAGRFALNMRFVAGELFRAHATGTNVCIHIQQLLAYKNQHGFAGRRDFRGAMVDLFRAAGFNYLAECAADPITPMIHAASVREMLDIFGDDHPVELAAALLRGMGLGMPSEFVIPKDPQAMAQRLSLHSLQFKTGHSRSSTNWASAPNDYVLVFQKPGEVAVPVRPLIYKPGQRPMTREDFYAQHDTKDAMLYAKYLRDWGRDVGAINAPGSWGNPDFPGGWLSATDWIKWASGVWHDIDEFDIIDGARAQAEKRKLKEAEEEKHVCPLQLEIVRRCVLMYSNPTEIQPDVCVLDPFMGVGSTAAACVELGRNAVGFELKESYHANALKNVERYRKAVAARDEGEVDDLFSKRPEPVVETGADTSENDECEILNDELAETEAA